MYIYNKYGDIVCNCTVKNVNSLSFVKDKNDLLFFSRMPSGLI